MIGRRGFLAALAAGTASLVADPEQLLWTPGKVKVFDLVAMPKPAPALAFHPDAFSAMWPEIAAAQEVRDAQTGISMRFVREFPLRIDVLYGFANLDPSKMAMVVPR